MRFALYDDTASQLVDTFTTMAEARRGPRVFRLIILRPLASRAHPVDPPASFSDFCFEVDFQPVMNGPDKNILFYIGHTKNTEKILYFINHEAEEHARQTGTEPEIYESLASDHPRALLRNAFMHGLKA